MNDHIRTTPDPTAPPTNETRLALLKAARRGFSRNGFDGASIRSITAEAGANLGAVTYHFGSKRGLYDTLLRTELEPLIERVRAAVAGEGSGLERMVGVTEAYFEHLAEHPELPHLLLQEVAAGREPPEPVAELLNVVRGLLMGLHADGRADGSIRASHPAFAGLSVIAQPVYLTLITPALRSIAQVDLDDAAVRTAATEHMKEFVRRGLAARPEEVS